MMFCPECGEKLNKVEYLQGVRHGSHGVSVDLMMNCKNEHRILVTFDRSNTSHVTMVSRNNDLVDEMKMYVEIAGDRLEVKRC